MNDLTASQIWAAVLAIASAVVLLSNAAEKIAKAWQAAKAPNVKQDIRLKALEDWREEVDRKLLRDHDHLQGIDAGNRVTQRALLALLDHGLDGNNLESMQQAKKELQSHLINR